MIFVLAANRADAQQWALFNGYATAEYVSVTPANFMGRRLSEEDRIVRTARAAEHPDHEARELVLAGGLVKAGLTETSHGRLVRRES